MRERKVVRNRYEIELLHIILWAVDNIGLDFACGFVHEVLSICIHYVQHIMSVVVFVRYGRNSVWKIILYQVKMFKPIIKELWIISMQ